MFLETTLLLITLILLAYARIKHAYTYWQRRNIPQVAPKFPSGNMSSFFTGKKPMYEEIGALYNSLKGHSIGGFYIFTSPKLLLLDPEAIKIVLSSDFSHFTDRPSYFNEKVDPLSAHLIWLRGERWKVTRKKLTPTFTSGRIKMMFQTFNDCADCLIQEVAKLGSENLPVDIRELVSRYTTDVIASCAFGVECNSLKDPQALFRKYGKKAYEMNFLDQLKAVVFITLPKIAEYFRMTQIKPDVSSFFFGLVETTVKYREEHQCTRNDFMQLLINSMNSPEGLTLNEIAAQAYVFFMAGFETSATTLTYCFYELAKNGEVQDKLRGEIEAVLRKHEGRVTFDSVSDMKYLGQIVDETLRKYPPGPVVLRQCTQEFQFPSEDSVIEKGTLVTIPVYALHHDPDFFPNPEAFDPDRFSEENRGKIVPYTYLPFGEGPRNCIGLRFGKMQTKIGVMSVVKNFQLRLNRKTPEKLTMEARSVTLLNKETIYLDIQPIS